MNRRMNRIFYNQQRRLMRCNRCGTIQIVSKRASMKTSVGHIKDMYCWKCKSQTEHIQQGEI